MKRLFTALTLALFVAGSASVAMADGADDWNKNCAKCHGADGKGSKMGKKLGASLEKLSALAAEAINPA